GHISPLAAYNKETDRFLILDVSRYKYPPVWVKAEDLWKAMNTKDSVSDKTRGFVLVSKN
ncbi:MAG: phytochelatin synthase family protein, partial [Rivularia sp. (in: cyanobacteria)]